MNTVCPNCKTLVNASGLRPGDIGECPSCGKAFEIPGAKPSNGRITACPDCGGRLSVQAQFCPHCGRSNAGKTQLTGIDIPFWDMVKLLIEIAVAAIPAMIILWVIGMGVAFIITLIMNALRAMF